MSWRTVVISSRSKLDYRLGHLVVRTDQDETRIHLGDIATIICESTAISLTTYLLSEIVRHKIKIIFCDDKHNPLSELIPYYGSYDTSDKIRSQIQWPQEIKALVWQRIVQTKIAHQAWVLEQTGHADKAKQLRNFQAQVQPGDITNREGHAAKVYFNALFSMDFSRDQDNAINATLNYGYAILLSACNREAAATGYLTQLGIWHDNGENQFNLGCDLMESFRPLIDIHAVTHEATSFGKQEKLAVIDILNKKIRIANSQQYVNNAIGIYVRSVFAALESGETNKIQDWYEL